MAGHGIAVRRSFALLALIATTACGQPSNATPSEPPAPSASIEPPAVPAEASPASAPAAAPAAPATADWSGRYAYDFSDGTNVAGTAVVVSYALTLTPKSCRLTAEGYQTDETITCRAKPAGEALDVAFVSYGDGGVTDRYGNAVYSPGDTLFTLRRAGGKLLTKWKGYPLPDDKRHPEGTYFVRSN